MLRLGDNSNYTVGWIKRFVAELARVTFNPEDLRVYGLYYLSIATHIKYL